MKINRIELRNITSFLGVHVIDFDNMLGDTPLFAITGQTGAGKSSILNSITMALFGDIPKNLNAGDIISLGSEGGAITLFFETGGKKYHIEWSAKVLKKDGTPLKQVLTSRQLYCNEILLDIPITEVIGLNFEEFSRSVFLGQGEFSRFLLGSFSDRKSILERLSGTMILTQMGSYLKERARTFEQEIRDLEQQLVTLIDLDPIHLEAQKRKLTQTQQSIDSTYSELNHLKELLHPLKEIQKELERLHSTQEKEESLTAELSKTKEDYFLAQSEVEKKAHKKQVLEKEYERLAPRVFESRVLAEKLKGHQLLLAESQNELIKVAEELTKQNQKVLEITPTEVDSKEQRALLEKLKEEYLTLKSELKTPTKKSTLAHAQNLDLQSQEAISLCQKLYLEHKECPVCFSEFHLLPEIRAKKEDALNAIASRISSTERVLENETSLKFLRADIERLNSSKNDLLAKISERQLATKSSSESLNQIALSNEEHEIFIKLSKEKELALKEHQNSFQDFNKLASSLNYLEGQTTTLKLNIKDIQLLLVKISARFFKALEKSDSIPNEIAPWINKLKQCPDLTTLPPLLLKELVEKIDFQIEHRELKGSQLQETLGELKNEISFLSEKVIQKETLSKKVMELKERALPISELLLIFGKQDDFKNYVLTKIERELIALTNKELSILCGGRYQIEQVEKRLGADFYIIDYFQDGAKRKLATLSGGETFLVSLAISLSLAEMVRGSVAIDSFFIDEGFGTLDENSLDEVLEILNELAARGKQIGIISHVKELTDRIPVIIEVKKGLNGNSEIIARGN